MENKTCDVSKSQNPSDFSEITFCADQENWVMKIVSGKVILFNRKQYPEATPDDFAQAIIDIL